MYKYEEGEIVRVVELASIKWKNKSPRFVDGMEQFCGQAFTINRRFVVGDGSPCYRFVGNDYSWREDWLEPDLTFEIDSNEFANFLLT